MLTFHSVCVHHHLLHTLPPSLLPFVISFFFVSLLLPKISFMHYHSIYFMPCSILNPSTIYFKISSSKHQNMSPARTPHPSPHSHHPSAVTDLRMKARRSSVPPGSSFFCHLTSQPNEYQGTGEGEESDIQCFSTVDIDETLIERTFIARRIRTMQCTSSRFFHLLNAFYSFA